MKFRQNYEESHLSHAGEYGLAYFLAMWYKCIQIFISGSILRRTLPMFSGPQYLSSGTQVEI